MDAVHVAVVLDRSGSMASIADEMVKGFNGFLAEQRQADGSETSVSLVQFDGDDPLDVLIDRVPLREVTDLERERYQPRGVTPLYDAIGAMIARIDATADPEEDQVVLIITDGLENASREHTRASVFDMIRERQDKGWAFVFLGADQDVYAEGERVGISPSNRVAWEKSGPGQARMWRDTSSSTVAHRLKLSQGRRRDSGQFYRTDEEGD